MKLLNRYVLCEWLMSFFCTHAVMTCFLILEDFYKNFCYFFKAGATVLALGKYCFFLFILFFPFVTPIAIFISVIFALSQLHRRNEITAMRCATMNILEISKPIIFAGIILATINLAMEILVVPHAMDHVVEFRLQADSKSGSNTRVKRIGLINRLNHREWFFKILDKLSYEAKDITVSCYGAEGEEELRVFAKEGRFDPNKNHWIFTDGSVTHFDRLTGVPSGAEIFEKKEFETFDEHPKIAIASAKKAKNLSFSEILDAINYHGKDFMAKAFWVKLHGIFSNAANCLIVLLLAIPFAVVGPGNNSFANVAKASGVLILFLICKTIFMIFGNNGTLPPFFAAWAASFLMIFPLQKLFRGAM
jgi:lipopolysaccharide export system permease protein